MARRDLANVAVHSLDHVGFEVPDLEEARTFYSTFGLDVKDATNPAGGKRLEVSTHGDARPWLFIDQSKTPETRKKKLGWISFGAYEEDLPAIHARLEKLAKRAATPTTREANALFYEGPHGVVLEVRATPKRTIDEPEVRVHQPRQDRGAPLRSKSWKVQPTRLSHALVFSPDIAATVAFYTEALGLRVSDDSPGIVFLHAPHGSDHHLIAFAKGPSAGLHHVSWSVPSFDDVGLGAMQMAEKGFTRGWGVGRHVLGSNYFHYVRDPWGSYSEYSFDIDHIPSTVDWPASTQSPEDGFYLWGPNVPEDFITNYEAADAPPA
jgi:catechol 2,3-dioxygenase-like lactoylglutathione lyase family enzyme